MSIPPEKENEFYRCWKIHASGKPLKGTTCPMISCISEKAAFSDAVGHSVVDNLKAYAEKMYSDEDLDGCAS
jgi:asparagine synthase (glutamine-hydrolysing)